MLSLVSQILYFTYIFFKEPNHNCLRTLKNTKFILVGISNEKNYFCLQLILKNAAKDITIVHCR